MYTPGMEAFLHVVKHGGFSKAAEHLHLTQSSISKRLMVLEEELGYSLVERGRGIKQLSLTEKGEEFVRIAESWHALQQEARQLGQKDSRVRLTIGTVPSANMTFIPDVCRRFWSNDLGIDYRVASLHSIEMYDMVESRQVDVGFSLIERVNRNILVTPCFAVPLVGLRLKGKHREDTVEVQGLDPSNCIFINWGAHYEEWYERWFGSGPAPKAWIDSPAMLRTLLEHEEQWAVVPQAIANLLQENGKLETFRLNPQPPDRIFYKLTHKHPRAQTHKAVQFFNVVLDDELRRHYKKAYTIF